MVTTTALPKIDSGRECLSDAHQGLVATLSRRWVACEGAVVWLKVLHGQMGFVGQWPGRNRP
jgi:hypothetical protein